MPGLVNQPQQRQQRGDDSMDMAGLCVGSGWAVCGVWLGCVGGVGGVCGGAGWAVGGWWGGCGEEEFVL